MSAQPGNRCPPHRPVPGAPRGCDPGRRNLVMVPAWPGQLACHELGRLASAGERPRTDYVELARELDADVMDMEYMDSRATRLARGLARHVGLPTAQVAEAFLRRDEYAHVVARADRLGLPLALLHKVFRGDGDVVLVSGWLSRPRKAVFLRPLHVHTHLLAIVNYSSMQMSIAAERLQVPAGKLHHALQPVDLRFWQPVEAPTEDIIASAGYEARDYATLLEAVRGSKVRAELAVGTTVFESGDISAELSPALRPLAQAPPNVTIHQQLSHLQLRALYARSRFVVVPVQDVEFDAGVTCIAEAMAMGKAVVVTRSRGQVDLVRHGTTGLYVPPGDPRALRQAIDHLMAHPEQAARMGREGRAFAEENLSLDEWVSRVAAVTLAS